MEISADEINVRPIFVAEEKYNFNDIPKEHCVYCGIHNELAIAKCESCEFWFCNSSHDQNAGSHIFMHAKIASHLTFSTHPNNPNNRGIFKCSKCPASMISDLEIVDHSELYCRKCAMLKRKQNPKSTFKELMHEKFVQESKLQGPRDEERNKAVKALVKNIKTIERNMAKGNYENLYEGLEESEEYKQPLPKIKLRYGDANEYYEIYANMLNEDLRFNRNNSKEEVVKDIQIKINGKEGEFVYNSLSTRVKMRFGSIIELKINKVVYDAIVIDIDKKNDKNYVKFVKSHQLANGVHKAKLSVKFIEEPYNRMLDGLNGFKQGWMSEDLISTFLGQSTNIPPSLLQIDSISDFSAKGLPDLNPSQKNCVRVSLSSRLTLIQGPPGTGKTHTSATILYNLAKLNPNKKTKILMSSSSNVAVDNLVERIAKTGLTVVKICSRIREKMPSSNSEHNLHMMIKEYLKTHEPSFLPVYIQRAELAEMISTKEEKKYQKLIPQITKEILQSADVICCTNIVAFDSRLDDYEFNYVLIDEANQSTEPECLLPLLHNCQHAILVGDQMQLGPMTKCGRSANAGLNRSLFSRLVHLGISPLVLDIQYRMHPSISNFPRNFFYEGILHDGITEHDRAVVPDFWPNNIPIVFIDHKDSEGNSSGGTSFVNPSEAFIVWKAYKKMIKARIKRESIVVLTPYEGQKRYLTELIGNDANVFNIDEYQGKETDYVIFSTVRSNEKHSLGFLEDFRRMNVAITRARFGLVIVGDARMISESKLWRHLIKFYSDSKMIFSGNFGSLKCFTLQISDPEPYNFRMQFLYADASP